MSAGFYILAKVQEALDMKIYRWTKLWVSGHTLKHLSSAMVPVFIMIMLYKRNMKSERWFHSPRPWSEWLSGEEMSYFERTHSWNSKWDLVVFDSGCCNSISPPWHAAWSSVYCWTLLELVSFQMYLRHALLKHDHRKVGTSQLWELSDYLHWED